MPKPRLRAQLRLLQKGSWCARTQNQCLGFRPRACKSSSSNDAVIHLEAGQLSAFWREVQGTLLTAYLPQHAQSLQAPAPTIRLVVVGIGLGNSTASVPFRKKRGDEYRRPRVSNLFILSYPWVLFIPFLFC